MRWLACVWLSCACSGTGSTIQEFGTCPAIETLSMISVEGPRELQMSVGWVGGQGMKVLTDQAAYDVWLSEISAERDDTILDVRWDEEDLVVAWISGGGCSGPQVEWDVFESDGGTHAEIGFTSTDGTCRAMCDMAWSQVTGIVIAERPGELTACMRYRETCE